MAVSRQTKERILSELTEQVQSAKSLVFARFSHVPVKDLEALRKQAKKEGVRVMVAKKTLLERATKAAGLDVAPSTLPESILTLFGTTDEVAPAKLIATFAKGKETVSIVGGVLEGKGVPKQDMVRLAALPSKQELYAKLVGTMQAPVSGFVNVLSGNLRGLVTVLKAVSEKKA
jgi:large subunit ribosomal protein L10